MKCEQCQTREACISVKQMLNGNLREMHLCQECAIEKGLSLSSELAEMLIGGLMGGDAHTPADERREQETRSCPGCHFRASDFRKHSRLGCERCYETFSDLLAPMLATLQLPGEHKGKRPAREDVHGELARLRQEQEEAILRERYEQAAALRDRIEVLELAREYMQPPAVAVAPGHGGC